MLKSSLMVRARVYVFLAFFLLTAYALTFSSSVTSSTIGEGDSKIVLLSSFVNAGQVNVMPHRGVEGLFGLSYTWHEFGQNFFVLPFFIILKSLRGTGYPFFISNAVLTALAAVLLMKMLMIMGYGQRASCLTSLFYGLGTFAWFYAAKAPFEQPVAVFLLLGEFYFVLKYVLEKPARKRHYLFISAAFMGFGVLTKTELALSAIPLAALLWGGLGGLPERKKVFVSAFLVFFLVLIPFAAFYLFYDFIRFGSLFQTGYSRFVSPAFFKPRYLPMGIAGFLFSPGKSMFLYSPVILLAMFFARDFSRRVPKFVFRAVCLTVLVYFLFYSTWVDWHGDYCWGPRYLLLITPFLVMPMASLFERWRGLARASRALALAALVASVTVQAMPAVSNYYLGLVMKYGWNSNARSETRLRLGDEGSVSLWESFFRIKESAFINQFGIFADTTRASLDPESGPEIIARLQRKWPTGIFNALMKWDGLYRFDLWWAQAGTREAYLGAGAIFILALSSLCGLAGELKRE